MSYRHFLWFTLFVPGLAFSQQKFGDSIFLKTADGLDSIRVQIPTFHHPIDSATFKEFSKLENAHSIINGIDHYLNQIVDTAKITNELSVLESKLVLAKYSLVSSDHHYEYRLLKISSILLEEVSERLHLLEKNVQEMNSRFRANDSLINSYLLDSSLFVLPIDTETRETYINQFRSLYSRVNKVDSANNAISMQFSHVLATIVKDIAAVEDLRRYSNYLLRDFNNRLFDRDGPPLLEASSNHYKISFPEVTKLTMASGYKIFIFYVGANLFALLGFLVLLPIIFVWAHYLRKKFLIHKHLVEKIGNIEYVQEFNVSSVLIFWLTLFPVFFPNMPAVTYVATLMMALIVTYLFWKKWPLKKWLYWVGFFILSRGIAWFNLYLYTTTAERWLFFFFELFIIAWCIAALRYTRKNFARHKDTFALNPKVSVALFYLTGLMQIVGLVANLSGHYGLSKIMGAAGVIGIFSAIIFSLFVRISLELLSMQLELFKQDKDQGILNSFKQILGIFRKILIVFAVFGWLVLLSKTLNLYDFIYGVAADLLYTPRQVGEIIFTFGSVAIFFIIIWVATMLSTIISFFVDTGSIHVQKRSRFANFKLLIKLGIVTCGIFLAFAASGIPIDKLTIVFGALSVGIGFGLQNLVSNIVSGIVISFERPIRLGDTVEIDSQIGIVKEIGVRACKLYTDDGLDLIVPNGEILSKNITNWTLSSPTRRIQYKLSVELDTDIIIAKESIERIMEEHNLIVKSPKPRVLISNIEKGAIIYTCDFWCKNVWEGKLIKSAVLESITREFRERGIKFDDNKIDLLMDQQGYPAKPEE